jgi:hypothetical protein
MARLIRTKTVKTQIDKNQRGNITTDLTDMKRPIKEYQKQLCLYEFNNLDEIDNSLQDTCYKIKKK